MGYLDECGYDDDLRTDEEESEVSLAEPRSSSSSACDTGSARADAGSAGCGIRTILCRSTTMNS